MKPRSNVERRYVDLANSLPPAGPEVLEWAKGLFDEYALFWKHRGKSQEIWCQCCGHREPCDDSWLIMSTIGYNCPECGRHLDIKNFKEETTNNAVFVSVLDVFQGEQVIRVFEAYRSNHNDGNPTYYGMCELYQCWITEKGREVITTRGYSRAFNFFSWNYGASYQIGTHRTSCSGYYYYEDAYKPEDNYIYPKMRFTKMFRNIRIGKKAVDVIVKRKMELGQTLAYLAVSENIETVAKIGYERLYWALLKRRKDFRRYRHSINICHRNRYVIANPDLWLDYVDNLIELGLDTHNAHYVCPDDLLKMHSLMTKRVQKKREKEKLEKQIRDAKKSEERYRKMRSPFFSLVFNGGEFSVVCIKSVEEVAKEGSFLHHCVFTNEYYKMENSLLLSARDSKGNPIETAEIDLRTMNILQCRGRYNQNSPLHDRIVKVIKENMWRISDLVKTRTAKVV